MRVTIWLFKFAVFLLLFTFSQSLLKVGQPLGVTLMVWVGLAIPVVALLELLGFFGGLARWMEETRPRG